MTAPLRHEEHAFTAADGVRLYAQRWLPEATPRGHVAIVHGYAEHSGRYAHVGAALAARGYAVHALDLRGHGRSDGDRAIVRSFAEFLGDVRAFLSDVRRRADGSPLFLLGHSMGGAIVTLELAVDHPALAGALLSGAVLPSAGPPRVVTAIVGLVGRLLPRLPLVKLDAAHVSRDPDVVARYVDDPLVFHGRVRAGLIAAMGRAIRRIERDARSIALPVLIMHGADDKLASPEGSRLLYDRISSQDKTLTVYEGLHHEILNEPEQDRVIADIAAWLDARTARAAGESFPSGASDTTHPAAAG
jgi:alpha-beta hydrolase superfamily lysophospholipase